MAHPLTLPTIGLLTLAGIGAGIHLGHSAIAEINPMYFSEPETRFHADLSANRPSDSLPAPLLAQASDSALGTGCIGCRTYPEEYFPVHEASLGRYSSGYASSIEATEPAVAEEQPDPEVARLRQDIERVGLYARGSAEVPTVQMASVETAPAAEIEDEEAPPTQ